MKLKKTFPLILVLSVPLIANTLFNKNNIEKNVFKILSNKSSLTSTTHDDYVEPKPVKTVNIEYNDVKIFSNIGSFFTEDKFLKNHQGFAYDPRRFNVVLPNQVNSQLNYEINKVEDISQRSILKKVVSLKIADYASSWTDFKQKYPNLKFKFNFKPSFLTSESSMLLEERGLERQKVMNIFPIKKWVKSTPKEKESESKREILFNLDDIESSLGLPTLSLVNSLIPINNENKNNLAKLNSRLFLKLENNNLNLYLEQNANFEINSLFEKKSSPDDLNLEIYYKIFNYIASTYIQPISLTSEFVDKNEVNKINSNLESLKDLSINMTNQDTHADISNNTVKNKNEKTDSKYRNKTNKEYIESEVERIIKKAFTVESIDLWDRKYKQKMRYSIEFQPTSNRIKIFFKDINPDEEPYASRFYNNLLIPINLTFHPEFFQKEIQNRITITPSQILDPTTNELILDQPEVEIVKQDGQIKSQIFWYHNTVKVEFRAVDGTEQLLVENQPTEVYNNIYFKTLVDKRFLKNQDETTSAKSIEDIKKGLVWNVSVNQKEKSNPIDIKIGVKSINPNLSFKWKGWNPEADPSKPENYQQYKLVTPQIDSKPNPDYDKTINPSTGTRKEIIWVNSDSQVKNFYQDPYDKNDILNQTSALANFGYIAEASVVNSGANYLFNNNDPSGFGSIKSAVSDLNKSIGEIEINKYDDNFTNATKQTNTNQNSALEIFSLSRPGIYHYNIPIKDFVEQKNTFDPSKIQSENITPKIGSSLHKYLIINNKKDKYQSFLKIYGNINAKKKNKDKIPKIQSFWESPAGQHLKFFLIHNQLIKSSLDVEKYSYEEIVSLWNYYVSVVKQGTIVLPHGVSRIKSLSDIQFSSIKIKANTKQEAINLVKQEALKQIQKQTKNNNISLSDFEINDVESLKWSNFLDINNNNQQMSIRFVASPTSLLLSESSLNVLVLNSNNFASKANDLSQMNFKDITYNFSDYAKQQNNEDEKKRQEKFVNNFITQHISQTIRLHRQNDNDSAIQNADYEVYINKHKITQFIFNFDAKDQQQVDKEIKQFFEFIKSKDLAQLEIEIKSVETSFKLKGLNKYLITHRTDANKAPEAPEPFNWPEEDNSPIDKLNPEVQKYFDLLLLKIGDWIGDFSKWTFEQFEKTIINETIIKKLIEQAQKPIELNKDFIIRINDNLYNKKAIEDFFKSKGKLKITIQSISDPINREKVLINYRNIFLHNTLDGKAPEELTPDSNGKDPNNPSNNNSNNTQKSKVSKITLIVSILIFIISTVGIFGLFVRWKTRKM
ncbi:Mbov_0399 family ICE element protein [Mycoplasma putrefaciens]|uniref:ICEF-II n=1 Tax=Mycoplasma putrefaciens Mput9231 TaxID=1292033 RepID=M9WD07_9MOLU|nr:hypothetical protein [Mycoplasma putrefaciens]AGJ90716.1 Hypothetical protein MPUT9231_2920 [Mycoplasma putrefaciens Mput9231]